MSNDKKIIWKKNSDAKKPAKNDRFIQSDFSIIEDETILDLATRSADRKNIKIDNSENINSLQEDIKKMIAEIDGDVARKDSEKVTRSAPGSIGLDSKNAVNSATTQIGESIAGSSIAAAAMAAIDKKQESLKSIVSEPLSKIDDSIETELQNKETIDSIKESITEVLGSSKNNKENILDEQTKKLISEKEQKKGIGHTYYSDLSSAMGSNEPATMSELLKKARFEKKSKEIFSPRSKKNMAYIIGAFLLLGGIVWIISSLIARSENTVEYIKEKRVSSLVYSDMDTGINLTNIKSAKIKQAIRKVIETKIPKDTFNQIYYVAKDPLGNIRRVGIKQIFDATDNTPPAILYENIENDFMHGVYKTDKNHPFIILKALSYDRAFKGMKEWEPTMIDDLSTYLDLPKEAGDRSLLDSGFNDGLIKNKNVRVARFLPRESDKRGVFDIFKSKVEKKETEKKVNDISKSELILENTVVYFKNIISDIILNSANSSYAQQKQHVLTEYQEISVDNETDGPNESSNLEIAKLRCIKNADKIHDEKKKRAQMFISYYESMKKCDAIALETPDYENIFTTCKINAELELKKQGLSLDNAINLSTVENEYNIEVNRCKKLTTKDLEIKEVDGLDLDGLEIAKLQCFKQEDKLYSQEKAMAAVFAPYYEKLGECIGLEGDDSSLGEKEQCYADEEIRYKESKNKVKVFAQYKKDKKNCSRNFDLPKDIVNCENSAWKKVTDFGYVDTDFITSRRARQNHRKALKVCRNISDSVDNPTSQCLLDEDVRYASSIDKADAFALYEQETDACVGTDVEKLECEKNAWEKITDKGYSDIDFITHQRAEENHKKAIKACKDAVSNIKDKTEKECISEVDTIYENTLVVANIFELYETEKKSCSDKFSIFGEIRQCEKDALNIIYNAGYVLDDYITKKEAKKLYKKSIDICKNPEDYYENNQEESPYGICISEAESLVTSKGYSVLDGITYEEAEQNHIYGLESCEYLTIDDLKIKEGQSIYDGIYTYEKPRDVLWDMLYQAYLDGISHMYNEHVYIGDAAPIVTPVQEVLSLVGLMEAESITGEMDLVTQDAISIFQEVNGIPQTGVIDPITLNILDNIIINQGTVFENNNNAAIDDYIAEAPPIGLGAYSNDVQEIQMLLYTNGYDVSNINGVFDDELCKAVNNYEETNNLPQSNNQNCIISSATIESLNLLIKEGDYLGSGFAVTEEIDVAASGPFDEYIGIGSVGSQVTLLQEALQSQGYYNGNIDGIFDQEVLDALNQYQEDNNLPLSGGLNSQTVFSLNQDMSQDGQTSIAFTGLMELGMSSGQISKIQNLLKDQGYYNGAVNGVFNENLCSSLQQYQRDNNLTVSKDIKCTLDSETIDSLNILYNSLYPSDINQTLRGFGLFEGLFGPGTNGFGANVADADLLKEGDIVLIYTFLDEKTILITRHELVITEIIKRRAFNDIFNKS